MNFLKVSVFLFGAFAWLLANSVLADTIGITGFGQRAAFMFGTAIATCIAFLLVAWLVSVVRR